MGTYVLCLCSTGKLGRTILWQDNSFLGCLGSAGKCDRMIGDKTILLGFLDSYY